MSKFKSHWPGSLSFSLQLKRGLRLIPVPTPRKGEKPEQCRCRKCLHSSGESCVILERGKGVVPASSTVLFHQSPCHQPATFLPALGLVFPGSASQTVSLPSPWRAEQKSCCAVCWRGRNSFNGSLYRVFSQFLCCKPNALSPLSTIWFFVSGLCLDSSR